jgi:predicted amidohydrolase
MFLLFSNGVGIDDDEVRTGNAMILDPYGQVLVETWKAQDDMVMAELKANQLDMCTGRRWIRGRRPELYETLIAKRGDEFDPRAARFSHEQTRTT